MNMPTIHQSKSLTTQPKSQPIDQVMTNLGYRLLGHHYNSCEHAGEFAIERDLLTHFADRDATFTFTKDNITTMEYGGRRLFGTNLIVRALGDRPELNTHWTFFYFHDSQHRSTDREHGLIVRDQNGIVIYAREPGQSLTAKPQQKTRQDITLSDDLRASA